MDCIFCQIIAKKAPALIVYEDETTIAFLDKNPQSRGHLQFVPKKHVRWVYEIDKIDTFFATAQWITRVIIPVLSADYVSWATFGTEVAHAHLWIVPRYKNSPKFMEGRRGTNTQNEQFYLHKLLRDVLRGEVFHLA